MNKASFLKTSAWFNCHPKCHKLLIFSEKFSVAVYYIAYIILLVLLLYQKNSDFYNFFRSMQAYRNAFANPNDILILNPDSDILQYLKKIDGSAQ